ncbi:MAG: GTPase HflX [Rubrobacteraceae bacterium]
MNGSEAQSAVLVGAGERRFMGELARLANTLGLRIGGSLEQNRMDGAGYLGRGKREELATLVEESGARFVVTDDELTASQARVLEQSCDAIVVDRTELIIRIFESHARDAASRLEVELADLEYRLPRIKGRNPALSRLGGGVGGGRITRGPGEQQLEYDRRAIRRRMEVINRKLAEEKCAREIRGARLREEGPPTVSLVGYTNAGKTTILNALCGADRPTANRLFETLETTTRFVSGNSTGPDGPASSGKPAFVVTDTVGFIRKLPTQLVESFSSTLESARDAGILVLCADASSSQLDEEIEAVLQSLRHGDRAHEEADGASTPTILCLNKIDLLSDEELMEIRFRYPSAVCISANENVGPLLEAIYEEISSRGERLELLIPHTHYADASRLYGKAEIHHSVDTNDGVWLDVTIPPSIKKHYTHYQTTNG